MSTTKYVSIRFYEKSNYCKIIPINKPFSTECYYLGGMDKNPFMAIDCLNNVLAIKAAKHKMFKGEKKLLKQLIKHSEDWVRPRKKRLEAINKLLM